MNILNSHPFQYGKWIFAHNGNLKNFDQYKTKLINHIDTELQRFILGTTDSEIIFLILLSLIKKRQSLSDTEVRLGILKEVTEELCNIVCQYSGPLYGGDDNNPKENHITFLLTSGNVMVGFNGGQNLNYSTYKNICPEREVCPYYSPVCEHPVEVNQQINHLIFSSEHLQGENIWHEMKKGEMIGVDSNMFLSKFDLNISFS